MTNTKTHDDNSAHNRAAWKAYSLTALKFAGFLLLAAFFVHFSWNMFAPDMFGAAEGKFRQALGLTIFAATLSFLLRGGRQSHAAVAQTPCKPGVTSL